jgi:hypothetical protein
MWTQSAYIIKTITQEPSPPKKPSTVFFGLISGISFLFPNFTPTKYAPVSDTQAAIYASGKRSAPFARSLTVTNEANQKVIYITTDAANIISGSFSLFFSLSKRVIASSAKIYTNVAQAKIFIAPSIVVARVSETVSTEYIIEVSVSLALFTRRIQPSSS